VQQLSLSAQLRFIIKTIAPHTMAVAIAQNGGISSSMTGNNNILMLTRHGQLFVTMANNREQVVQTLYLGIAKSYINWIIRVELLNLNMSHMTDVAISTNGTLSMTIQLLLKILLDHGKRMTLIVELILIVLIFIVCS